MMTRRGISQLREHYYEYYYLFKKKLLSTHINMNIEQYVANCVVYVDTFLEIHACEYKKNGYVRSTYVPTSEISDTG